MRDPATIIDPVVEAVIEETRQWLEGSVQCAHWQGDPDYGLSYLRAAIRKVEAWDSPDYLKDFAVWTLFEIWKKSRKKPTRHWRHLSIWVAAGQLHRRGFQLTRNEATGEDSASSIMREALRRLGEGMTEGQINAIVLASPPVWLLKKLSPPPTSVLKNPPG